MRGWWQVVAVVVVTLCWGRGPRFADGFSCVCSLSECEELSEEDCPGEETVWDPCGCCRVCARVENEPCGGPYGFHGSCARGLECVVAAPATGKAVQDANSEGVCTPHVHHAILRNIIGDKSKVSPNLLGTILRCDSEATSFIASLIR
uniref:IGFBP N-terminal domain-containing protein n=1 Tax=Timema genevievae TaxID=629358 RepID=A0A7R9JSA2_TIMGE|nr:unnamed protein product [Timema genevievae]